MPFVSNPILAGVAYHQGYDLDPPRPQAIPPHWDFVETMTTGPQPEVFNLNPSGSRVEVSWRAGRYGYKQTDVKIPSPGRYVLKASFNRQTNPNVGVRNQFYGSFEVVHRGSRYNAASGTFPKWSESNAPGTEHIAVIQVNTPVTIELGFYFETANAQIEGRVDVLLIDIVPVASDFGTPLLTLAESPMPSPDPVPEPQPEPVPGEGLHIQVWYKGVKLHDWPVEINILLDNWRSRLDDMINELLLLRDDLTR
jgi:hypothetical protein